MTSLQACTFMRRELLELGYDVDKEVLLVFLEAFEDMLNYTIATEQTFKLGNLCEISGYTKVPKKINGYYAAFPQAIRNKCWTRAKKGYPKIVWSSESRYCESMSPDEFFDQPEQRYTSLARKYRKDVNYAEIPEFRGMTEEEIVDICKRADAENIGVISRRYALLLARRHRALMREREARIDFLIKKDKQKQIENGVPPDQVVERTYEEIINEMYKGFIEWNLNKLNDASCVPTREKIDEYNKYIVLADEARAEREMKKLGITKEAYNIILEQRRQQAKERIAADPEKSEFLKNKKIDETNILYKALKEAEKRQEMLEARRLASQNSEESEEHKNSSKSEASNEKADSEEKLYELGSADAIEEEMHELDLENEEGIEAEINSIEEEYANLDNEDDEDKEYDDEEYDDDDDDDDDYDEEIFRRAEREKLTGDPPSISVNYMS